MSTLTKVAEFTGTRDFEAAALADAWCREQKISVGPLQHGAARGLMRGDVMISKWRNMTNAEHNQLDGRMTGDMRTGPVEIWMREESTPSTLRYIKPGDAVFVITQRRRNREPEGELKIVTKVGRKYGYLQRYRTDVPFCLDTGKSHHKESNERANGLGFDVYRCEADYLREVAVNREYERLRKRLVRNFCGLITLPHDVVTQMHRILDAAEID